MESKSSEQLHADHLPYGASSYSLLLWKKRIVGLYIVLFLVVIIVAASLTGLYLTQKHTEKMGTMIGSQEGQKFQQMILVNDQEDVALISVTTNLYSDSFLFDYRQRVIGIRSANRTECFLLGMDEVRTPSMTEILKTLTYLQTHKTSSCSYKLPFIWRPFREADPSELGMNVKLLCNGVPVYWAEEVRERSRRSSSGFSLDLNGGEVMDISFSSFLPQIFFFSKVCEEIYVIHLTEASKKHFNRWLETGERGTNCTTRVACKLPENRQIWDLEADEGREGVRLVELSVQSKVSGILQRYKELQDILFILMDRTDGGSGRRLEVITSQLEPGAPVGLFYPAGTPDLTASSLDKKEVEERLRGAGLIVVASEEFTSRDPSDASHSSRVIFILASKA